MAIKRGLDIVVMLHADGQYAAECLPDIVAPIIFMGRADVVLRLRTMEPGAASDGGMPLYKFVENRTARASRTRRSAPSEFHSGSTPVPANAGTE